MIINSIHLTGIGPHADTEVSWDLKSPIAICAEYGTGKTFLIEGALLCLFGKGAWYPSPYEALTQNGKGEGHIQVDFEAGGRRFHASRLIKETAGATRAQKAFLSEYNATGKLTQIAGPKVGDMETAVERLLGPVELTLATTILSQNKAGDLIGQPGQKDLVAHRRAMFGAMLGADRLDQISARVADQMRDNQTIIETLASQVAGHEDYDQRLAAERVQVEQAESDLKAARGVVAINEKALEDRRRQLRDAEGGDDVLTAQIAEAERAQSHAKRLADDLKAREVAIAALEARAEKAEVCRKSVAELAAAREKAEALDELQRAWEAWCKWNIQLTRLDDMRTSALRRITDLESVPGADEATKALAATLDSCRERYKQAKAVNEAAEKRNAETQKKIQQFDSQISAAKALLERFQKESDKKPETPGGEICATCPLMKSWIELPERIKDAQYLLRQASDGKTALPPLEALIDLAPIIQEGERARAAADAVKAADASAKALERARLDLIGAQAAHEGHVKAEPEAEADYSKEITATRQRINTLASAPSELAAAEQAAKDAEAKRLERFGLEAELTEANTASAEANDKAKSARAALADRENQRAALRKDIAFTESHLAEHRAAVDKATATKASAETSIRHYEGMLEQIAGQRKRIETLRADVEALKDLRACFGPRGVRQILMDDAAPELENIADTLFEQATGGRMRLRIATQELLRDGTMGETFQIQVKDGAGERDALRYSGGQLQLITIIFRLAVSLWSAKLHGRPAECLFLDEAFDRLGAEGTDDLLRVLEFLGDRIKQIVCVTHDPAIAARLRSQIKLRKSAAGVAVEVQ